MASRFAQARAWSSEFRQIVTNLAVKSGCRLEVPSGRDFEGIKDPKRTVEKVCRTYAGRSDQVLDLLRATVVADDLEQMYAVVRLLTETKYNSGVIKKVNGDGTYDVMFDSGRRDSAVPRSTIHTAGGSHGSSGGSADDGDGVLLVGDRATEKFDERVTVYRIKNKFDDAAEVKGGFRNIHVNLMLKHPTGSTFCGSTCCGEERMGFVCELQIQHRKVSSSFRLCTCRVWQKLLIDCLFCMWAAQMWEAERSSGVGNLDAHSRYIEFRNGRAE
jgi:hypothetical protein